MIANDDDDDWMPKLGNSDDTSKSEVLKPELQLKI